MIKEAHKPLMALLLLTGLLISQAGRSTTITNIDLNDFVASNAVTINSPSSAIIEEDTFSAVSFLSNDPFFGDPEVIVAANNRSLFFDYNFSEGSSNVDEFFAFVIDPVSGISLGPGFEFFADSSSSGTISFDLTSLVGLTGLGLQFELNSFDNSLLDSNVVISNVRLVDAMVPSPAALPLILIGILALRRNIRGEKKSAFC